MPSLVWTWMVFFEAHPFSPAPCPKTSKSFRLRYRIPEAYLRETPRLSGRDMRAKYRGRVVA